MTTRFEFLPAGSGAAKPENLRRLTALDQALCDFADHLNLNGVERLCARAGFGYEDPTGAYVEPTRHTPSPIDSGAAFEFEEYTQ